MILFLCWNFLLLTQRVVLAHEPNPAINNAYFRYGENEGYGATMHCFNKDMEDKVEEQNHGYQDLGTGFFMYGARELAGLLKSTVPSKALEGNEQGDRFGNLVEREELYPKGESHQYCENPNEIFMVLLAGSKLIEANGFGALREKEKDVDCKQKTSIPQAVLLPFVAPAFRKAVVNLPRTDHQIHPRTIKNARVFSFLCTAIAKLSYHESKEVPIFASHAQQLGAKMDWFTDEIQKLSSDILRFFKTFTIQMPNDADSYIEGKSFLGKCVNEETISVEKEGGNKAKEKKNDAGSEESKKKTKKKLQEGQARIQVSLPTVAPKGEEATEFEEIKHLAELAEKIAEEKMNAIVAAYRSFLFQQGTHYVAGVAVSNKPNPLWKLGLSDEEEVSLKAPENAEVLNIKRTKEEEIKEHYETAKQHAFETSDHYQWDTRGGHKPVLVRDLEEIQNLIGTDAMLWTPNSYEKCCANVATKDPKVKETCEEIGRDSRTLQYCAEALGIISSSSITKWQSACTLALAETCDLLSTDVTWGGVSDLELIKNQCAFYRNAVNGADPDSDLEESKPPTRFFRFQERNEPTSHTLLSSKKNALEKIKRKNESYHGSLDSTHSIRTSHSLIRSRDNHLTDNSDGAQNRVNHSSKMHEMNHMQSSFRFQGRGGTNLHLSKKKKNRSHLSLSQRVQLAATPLPTDDPNDDAADAGVSDGEKTEDPTPHKEAPTNEAYLSDDKILENKKSFLAFHQKVIKENLMNQYKLHILLKEGIIPFMEKFQVLSENGYSNPQMYEICIAISKMVQFYRMKAAKIFGRSSVEVSLRNLHCHDYVLKKEDNPYTWYFQSSERRDGYQKLLDFYRDENKQREQMENYHMADEEAMNMKDLEKVKEGIEGEASEESEKNSLLTFSLLKNFEEKPKKYFKQLSKQFSNHMSTDDADKGIFQLVDSIGLGDQERKKLKAMLGEAVFCYMTVASFQSYLEKSFDEIQEEVKLYSDEVAVISFWRHDYNLLKKEVEDSTSRSKERFTRFLKILKETKQTKEDGFVLTAAIRSLENVACSLQQHDDRLKVLQKAIMHSLSNNE
eukprot:g2570.t1